VIIAILVLGVIVLVFVLNSDSSIERIYVGNIEAKDMDDDVYLDSFGETLYVPLIADASGFGTAAGRVTVDVTFGDDPTVLYSEEIEMTGDMDGLFIPMNKFVQGNGEYAFTARTGDVVSEPSHFNVYWVTESLRATWSEAVTDEPLVSHSYEVSFTVTPQDRNGRNLYAAPMPYTVSGKLTKPAGGDVVIDVDWPARSSYIITQQTDHTMKGTYALEIEWTNLMCASNSPYYKVHLATNATHAVDAPPYADAGGDQTADLVGGSAEVSFDGSGSADDGSIVEYQWDFGDGTTENTFSSSITHAFTAAGEYYVNLVVVDDSGQLSSSRWGGASTVVVNG
jgi:PKD repeat protein